MSPADYPDGFWCAFTGTWQRPSGPVSIVLGSRRVATPRLAVAWMREQALRLAAALDPSPECGWLSEGSITRYELGGDVPDPGHYMRDWAQNWNEHETAMNLLRGGENYTIAAHDCSVVYYFSARPVVIPFVVEWRGKIPAQRTSELPAPAVGGAAGQRPVRVGPWPVDPGRLGARVDGGALPGRQADPLPTALRGEELCLSPPPCSRRPGSSSTPQKARSWLR